MKSDKYLNFFFQAAEGFGQFEGDRRPHRYKTRKRSLFFKTLLESILYITE